MQNKLTPQLQLFPCDEPNRQTKHVLKGHHLPPQKKNHTIADIDDTHDDNQLHELTPSYKKRKLRDSIDCDEESDNDKQK